MLKNTLWFCLGILSTSHIVAGATSYPVHIPDWFPPILLKKLNLEPELYLPFCKEKALVWSILEKSLSWTPPKTTHISLFQPQVIEQWADTLSPQQCINMLLFIDRLLRINTQKKSFPGFSIAVLEALVRRATSGKDTILNKELFALLTSPWLSPMTTITTFFGSTIKTSAFVKTFPSVQKKQTLSIALTIDDNEPAKITHTSRNLSFILKGNLSPKAFQYVVSSEHPLLFDSSSQKTISDYALSQDGTTVALVFLQHYLKVWKICWAKKQPSLREVFFCETTDPLISVMLSRTGDLMFFETKGTHTQKSPYALSSVNLAKHPKIVKLLSVASKPITYKEISHDGSCFIFMRENTVFAYLTRSHEGPVEINFKEPVTQIKLTQSRLPILVSSTMKKTIKTEWWMLARPFSFFTFYCLNALRHASSKHTIFGILPESLTEKFREQVAHTNNELGQNQAQFRFHYTFAKKPNDENIFIALWARKKNLNKPVYPW